MCLLLTYVISGVLCYFRRNNSITNVQCNDFNNYLITNSLFGCVNIELLQLEFPAFVGLRRKFFVSMLFNPPNYPRNLCDDFVFIILRYEGNMSYEDFPLLYTLITFHIRLS